MSQGPTPDRPRLGGILRLLPILALAACTPLESLVTPSPEPLPPLTCEEGPITAIAAVNPPLATCGERTFVALPEGFEPFLDVPITATLVPPDEASFLLVGTKDGRVGRIASGKKAIAFAESPALTEHTPRARYAFHPPGTEDLPPEAIVAIFPARGGLLAVSAGAGALFSDDGGATWEDEPFSPRLSGLPGKPPYRLRDLTVHPDGDIAFLHDPDPAIAPPADDEEVDEPTTKTHGGGPVLATGHIDHQKLDVYGLPLGPDHHLVKAPGPEPDLWVFVAHPTRHEMTRHVSPNWGKQFIDSGYFDLRALDAVGSKNRVAILGRDEGGRAVLWLVGHDTLSRFATIPLPDDLDRARARIDLPEVPEPEWLVVADGPRVYAVPLSEVGTDLRLIWYYLPVGLLALVVIVLAVRRALFERRLKKEWAAKAEALKAGVHWEEKLPPG